MKIIKRLILSAALLVINGCVAYHSEPITSEKVHESLKSIDITQIRLRAKEFKHSLLRPVQFDDRDGLSPDEAAILAVIANPILRAVRDRRQMASAELLQAGILPNPKLSYDFEIPVGGDTKDKVNAFGLGFRWNINSLFSRNAYIDAARAKASAVDLDVVWQEWQVAQAARLHSYRLIFAEKRYAVAEQAEISSQRLWKDIKHGVVLGVNTELDLLAAKISMQNAKSKVLDAESKIDNERLELNRSLGLPPKETIPIEKNINPNLNQSISLKELFKEVESKRFDLLALKLGYESQDARVRAAVRSQIPKINLAFTGSRDTDDFESIGTGLSVDLPFFDHNQGHIAKQRASRKQLFDEYTARVFEARADITHFVTAIKALQKQIVLSDESLSVMKEMVDGYHEAARVGQIEVLSYYRALSTLYDKRIKRLESMQSMIDLGIALEIASGHYGLISNTVSGSQKFKETVKNKKEST